MVAFDHPLWFPLHSLPHSQRAFPALPVTFIFFFFNDTATTEIYTLSLHDALPISPSCGTACLTRSRTTPTAVPIASSLAWVRSEEHTSELQSHSDLVCRLLLEKKKNTKYSTRNSMHFSTMCRCSSGGPSPLTPRAR